MARPRPKRKPTFIWQGLLILLPVAVLAALGFLSVRHDKLIAQHEAVQRSQEIVESLLPKAWAELASTTNLPEEEPAKAFEVDAAGRLLSPPPVPSTPVPVALDVTNLDPAQASLWLAARSAEISSQDPAPVIEAFRAFLSADPPEPFGALAQYSLGLLLVKTGDRDAAGSCFESVWDQYPGALGESGLPLKPLAGLKLLELKTAVRPLTVDLVNNLGSNLVWNPTPLSAEVLERLTAQLSDPEAQAAAGRWRQRWLDHEKARALFAAASEVQPLGLLTGQSGNGVPRAFWFGSGESLSSGSGYAQAPATTLIPTPAFDMFTKRLRRGSESPLAPIVEANQNWLALFAGKSTNGVWFVCRPRAELGSRLKTIVENSTRIPDYFGVGFEIAGRRLTWPAPDLHLWEYQNFIGRSGGKKKVYLNEFSTEVLASAAPEEGADILKASVYLTSRSALLAREQARSFWLAALVGAAALAAGVGFFKACRAFRHQLRLSELKSNFVSSVSHELRAPIASVRLLAESLERGKVPEPQKQRQYFQFIVQECRRLSALVENVLDFSRIEQGRKEYDFEPTDLGALAEQTVKLMEPYAAERQVTLQLRTALPEGRSAGPTSADRFQINGDGKALQQALVNLIDNAVKHSPKGQRVTVGLEHQAAVPINDDSPEADAGNIQPARTALCLWVEDHGEGIPPAEHKKIFERFYRRGSELRRETQGVGIGLSIVKHVVEAHGGTVQVRSDVGQGSRFTIELPFNNGTPTNPESAHEL